MKIKLLIPLISMILMLSGCDDTTGNTSDSSTAELASITLTPANTSVAKGLTKQLIATGTYLDGTSVDITASISSWSSDLNTIATVSDSGLVSTIDSGSALITASLNGISGTTTITATTAELISIALTPTNSTFSKNLTQQLTATGTYSDGTSVDITSSIDAWSSDTTSVAIVSSSGLVSGVNSGSTIISASLDGVSGHTTITTTDTTLESIAVTPSNPSIAIGLTQQLTATGTYSDGTSTDITDSISSWSSDTPFTVPVSTSGLVYSIGISSAVITASLDGISGTTTVTITAAQLQSIALTPANPSITTGSPQQLTATGTYSDGTSVDITTSITSWSSATTSSATVSAGLVNAVAAGSAVITASLDGISTTTTVTTTTSVLESIVLTPSNSSIAKGLTQQLTATGTYSDGTSTDITALITSWSSDIPFAAPVDSSGLVYSAGISSAVITASLDGISGTVTVITTAAALESIALTPSNPSIAKGLTQQLTATGTYSDGTSVDITASITTWSSGATSSATVNNSGLANAVDIGSALITASLDGISGTTTVTTTTAVLELIALSPSNPTLAKGLSQQLTATGSYSDGTSVDISSSITTWSSANTSAATIDSSGLVNSVDVGSALITATYSGISGTTTVTTTTAALESISLTPNNPSIAKGLTQQLTATGSYSDGTSVNITSAITSWNSDTTLAATVTSSGLVSSVDVGSALITASLDGISGTTTVTATAAALEAITLSPANPTLAKGLSQQLTATGSYSDGTSVDITASITTWSSSATTAATVSSAGLINTVEVGSAQITASLNGISDTTTITTTAAELVSIALTPDTQTIPAGTILQLTATGTYTDGTSANITWNLDTWVSSDITVASVSTTGLVISQGLVRSVVITATLNGVSGTTTVIITQAELSHVSIPSDYIIYSNETYKQLVITGYYTDGSSANVTHLATWSLMGNPIATIDSNGLVTALDYGSTAFSFLIDGMDPGYTTILIE